MDPDRPAYSEVDECTSWALAARDGDALAAAAFIRATQAETWRFVASLVDPESADDLTQETYLRAFRALPAFGAGPAPVPGCSVSPGARADHLRAAVRRRKLVSRSAALELAVPTHGEDPSAAVAAAELLAGRARRRRRSS